MVSDKTHAIHKWITVLLITWTFYMLLCVFLHHIFQMYVYLVLTDKGIKHFKCF